MPTRIKQFIIFIIWILGISGVVYYFHHDQLLLRLFSHKFAETMIKLGVLFSGAWCVLRLVDCIYWDWLFEIQTSKKAPKILRDFFAIVIWCATLFLLLAYIVDISITGFIATSGILGITLGLALKNVLADLFNGIILHIDLPFRLGETVYLHDSTIQCLGQVQEVTWRSTRFLTEDATVVLIPNQKICAMPITNYSLNTLVREKLHINIDNTLPIKRAITILYAAVKTAKLVDHTRSSKVLVISILDEGIHYAVRFYYDINKYDLMAVKSEIFENIYRQLSIAGISLGMPQEILYFKDTVDDDMDKIISPLTLLKMNPLFQSLNDDKLDMLVENIKTLHFIEGQTVITQGESGDSLFFIVEGLVDVKIQDQKDHQEISVAKLSMGDFFGEMSLLTGEPRSATITAETDLILYELTKSALAVLFEKCPEVMEEFAAVMSSRVSATSDMIKKEHQHNKKEHHHSLMQSLLMKIEHFFKPKHT